MSCQDWLRVLKLFELEVSTNRIASQLAAPYNTVYRAAVLLRHAILCTVVDAEILRRKGKRGRGAAGKVPVFGIFERQGIAWVEAVPGVRTKTLLGIIVKTVRRGSIVYTDRYLAYDSLMFCGYRRLSANHQKRFAHEKVYPKLSDSSY